MQSLTQKA